MTPFQPDDFFLHTALDQLACTRAHDVAAFVVQTVDRGADGYKSAIWTADLASGELKRFTTEASGASSPTWSPDGKTLAFLSARQGPLQQVHLIDRDGGEARQLGFCPGGAVGIDWSVDGKKLLVSSAVHVDPDSHENCAVRDEPLPPDAPQVAWCLPYKSDGMGYMLKRSIHLFVMDATTGQLTQLTHGCFDVLGACWSHDSMRVVYVRTVEGGQAHRTELWIADTRDGSQRRLVNSLATVQFPVWSRDGARIAFAGARTEGDPQGRLWVVDACGGEPRQVGSDEVEVAANENLCWSDDSRHVTLLEAYRSCIRFVEIDVDTGTSRTVIAGQRHIAGVVRTRSGYGFLAESIDKPREVHAVNEDGSNERAVSDFNAWWRERPALDVELRSFRVPDGKGGEEDIDGWYVRPRGAPGPFPLMVEAHGGPTSYAMVGYRWHTQWYVLASRGWSILALNPAGSSGYGREFAERLKGRWGELDLPQQLAAIASLQSAGLADERVAITGKSYGGYMSAWAVGHSRVFRAAIVSAPVANLESHLGTSDGGYYYDPYTMESEHHLNAELFRKLSPLQHIYKARTPTLILQGEDDQRCPRGQGEELFASLMRCGNAPALLVLYPGGDHHFFEQGKPSHRLDVVNRHIGWLERWIDVPVTREDQAQEENSRVRRVS